VQEFDRPPARDNARGSKPTYEVLKEATAAEPDPSQEEEWPHRRRQDRRSHAPRFSSGLVILVIPCFKASCVELSSRDLVIAYNYLDRLATMERPAGIEPAWS
jgi:hypothetical protein